MLPRKAELFGSMAYQETGDKIKWGQFRSDMGWEFCASQAHEDPVLIRTVACMGKGIQISPPLHYFPNLKWLWGVTVCFTGKHIYLCMHLMCHYTFFSIYATVLNRTGPLCT